MVIEDPSFLKAFYVYAPQGVGFTAINWIFPLFS